MRQEFENSKHISAQAVVYQSKYGNSSKSLTLIHIDPKAIRHTNRGPLFNARLDTPDGEVLVCSTEPLFASCRELVKRGITGHVRKYRDGVLSQEGDIEQLAGLTITEDDKDGLRIRKYRPYPGRASAKAAETLPEAPSIPPTEKAEIPASRTPASSGAT